MFHLAQLSSLFGIVVPLSQLGGKPGEVALTTTGVGDNVPCVVRVFGDDGVVDDSAGFVEEDGEGG